jgi:hypothetical protein
MGHGEDRDARNGIRDGICHNYYFGDGNCPSCRCQFECTSMVDETLTYISKLTKKRKSNPARNDD